MLRSVSGARGNEWCHQQCCKYRRLPSLRNGHTVRVFNSRGTVNHGTVRRQEGGKWSVFVVNEYGSPETFERWDYELFSLGIFQQWYFKLQIYSQFYRQCWQNLFLFSFKWLRMWFIWGMKQEVLRPRRSTWQQQCV